MAEFQKIIELTWSSDRPDAKITPASPNLVRKNSRSIKTANAGISGRDGRLMLKAPSDGAPLHAGVELSAIAQIKPPLQTALN
jgi:hypothetical protein